MKIKNTLKWKKDEERAAYLFVAPLVILMSIFVFYCVYFVFKVSFYKWDGVDINLMKFIGFKNYYWLFQDQVFLKSMANAIIWICLTIFFQLSFGLLLAILLRPRLIGHSYFKSIFYIPAALASPIIARIFIGLYEPNFGILNNILTFFHLEPIIWLGDPKTALLACIVANIFQWTGCQMVFYIAGLTTIPEDLFEAAQIDGAGFWKTLKKLVLPLLWPTHTTVIILGLIGGVKTFDLVWILTQGGPGNVSHMPVTYLYKQAVMEWKAGYGSTIAVMVISMCVGLSFIQQKIYERYQ
ncbi:MAG: sugar ABC transporter permease [Spirochaetes bacterium]|nr:sugar ABC transporter permease [Spirochaetota bacterium]